MNDKEKLERIHEISNKIWDWMCDLDKPITALVPAIEKIRELSEALK